MIQDFFCNTITTIPNTSLIYTNWLAKKIFSEWVEVKCRVGSLNSKEFQLLQFIDKTIDVNITTRKLYTDSSCDLKIKDKIMWEWNQWKVVYLYEPQDQKAIHHKKYFIQIIQ